MAKIGIDIDDTITNSSEIVIKYINEHNNEFENSNILLERMSTLIVGIFDHEVIREFFRKYAKVMMKEVTLKEDAVEIINKLKEEGNEIYFITARSNEYYGDATKYCENFLTEHGIKFDKVITGHTAKLETCQKEDIDIMIDDGTITCDTLNSYGIKSFLFTSDINKDKETISERVSNWKDAYTKINEFIDNTNN